MVKLIAIALTLCCIPQLCRGQDWLESNSNETEDANLYLEQLEQLKQHPMDLNTCSSEDLLQLPFLTHNGIESIIRHRSEFGDYIDVLELQRCDLSKEDIQLLLPYVYIRNGPTTSPISKYNHSVIATVHRQTPNKAGFAEERRYKGSPIRSILRYRGRITHKITVRYTGEKDMGEPFAFNGKQKGFDYHSLNLQVTQVAGFDKVILGDYSCDFGQGLTVGSGMRMGKSVLTMNSIKPSFGIKPYSSLNEYQFNRGMAFTGRKKKMHYAIWLHRKRVDGNIVHTDVGPLLSSYHITGFHRTDSEIEVRKTVLNKQAGLHLQRNFKDLQLGFTAVGFAQSMAYTPTTKAYQRFNFRGSRYLKTGISYRYSRNNSLFFGETTICSNKSLGNVHGVLVSATKHFGASILYRSFSKRFIPDQSVVFSEASTPRNETGLYFGSNYAVSYRLNLSFYVDRYWFPWMSYHSHTASNGTDYLVYVKYRSSKKLSWTVRVKHEVKQQSLPVNHYMRRLVDVQSSKLRFNVVHDPSKTFGLRCRLEMSRVNEGNGTTWGYLVYQDFRFTLLRSRLKVYLRFASANIDTYDNRIYTYENDVAYSYSLPFFQDNQLRSYMLVRYRLYANTDVWIKTAFDYKTESKGFGSGLDSVSSPRRTGVTFQIRIRL